MIVQTTLHNSPTGVSASSSKLTDSIASLTPKHSHCQRMSVHVQLLWTTLSLVVTAGCAFSFVQPHWFVQRQTRDALGLYNYCVRDPRSILSRALTKTKEAGQDGEPTQQICGVYGDEFDLSKLPSNAWQIACVLYGGGCFLLAFGAAAAVVTLCLPSTWSHKLSCYTGYIQTMAAIILLVSVVVFPVGLGSKFAQHYCPGAGMYEGGACHAGWAYILGVMSAALSVFCPFLSQYTDFNEDMTARLLP